MRNTLEASAGSGWGWQRRLVGFRVSQIGGAIALALSLTGPARAEPESFTWAMGDFAGQADVPVALLVGVTVGDRRCAMQLDTGMNGAVTWHGVAEPAPDLENRAPLSVAFAGINRSVSVTPAARKLVEQCAPGQAIASLGNAFFEDGTLTIDLGRREISFRPGSRLSANGAAQPFFYARWGDSGGHVLVEIGVEGQAKEYALLDSGSAAVGFGALSEVQWRRLTGSAPQAGGRVRAFIVSAWGRAHDCFIAPGLSDLDVGSSLALRPTVTFCPTLGFHAPIQLAGVLGLRALAGQVLVIDYPARRWLSRRADQ